MSIYITLFQSRYSMHAPLLVKTLLNNLFWNLFSLSPSNSILTSPPQDRHELQERLKSDHPVANQSCLLLLALTNYNINSKNLYRNAFIVCVCSL
ncbi:unnamed protein product [Leptidea sinapis]|uniref:Uncharacterized protein n=1 Tax=Leptidea sinapis TaxID=189913 RepID=A0A5E4QUJ7_9NEOP|nr:unnamed protein product [Leptidea sinapis]